MSQSSNMLERMAKVINPEAWRTLNTGFDTPTQYLFRLNTIDKAKEILLAMREPTDGMHKKMCDGYASPACHWVAGIDAALLGD